MIRLVGRTEAPERPHPSLQGSRCSCCASALFRAGAAPMHDRSCSAASTSIFQVLPSGDLLVTETVGPLDSKGPGTASSASFRRMPHPQGIQLPAPARHGLGHRRGKGTALKFESSRGGITETSRIWMPGATDATRTFVLEIPGPATVKFFDDRRALLECHRR